MSTLNEIENAVEHLPKAELDKFRKWFDDFDSELWDRKFESDVKAGSLNKLAEAARKDFQVGNYKEL